MTEERRQISLEELDQMIEEKGPKIAMANVQVSGIAVIKDKDGNVKSEMKITSLELAEDDDTCNS